MKKVFTVALVLFLAACAGTNFTPPTPEQTMQISCNSITTSVRVLTGYKAAGSLSAAQIAQIDEWKPISKAACSGTSTDSSLQAVIDIANGMLAIESEAK